MRRPRRGNDFVHYPQDRVYRRCGILVGEREFADLGVADNVYDQPGVPLLRWRHDRCPHCP